MSSNERERLNVIKVPRSNSKYSRRKDIAIHEDDFAFFQVLPSFGSYCIDAVDENKRICSLSVQNDVRDGRKGLLLFIWRLSALKQLNVEYFLLESSPVGLSQNLEELVIGFNDRPYHLPKEIDHLVNLKKIVLKEGICSLPTSIGNLNKLEWLTICCKSIKKVPEEIGNLRNLEVLELGCCVILVSIPASIGNLKNLKCLHIESLVQLASLLVSIGNLKKLEQITISETIIQELPNKIENLTN